MKIQLRAVVMHDYEIDGLDDERLQSLKESFQDNPIGKCMIGGCDAFIKP